MGFSLQNLNSLITLASKHNASDVHLRSGESPCLRIRGDLVPVQAKNFTHQDIKDISTILFNDPTLSGKYESILEHDGSFSIPEVCRLRYNFFRFSENEGIILRVIKSDIPSIEKLGLPLVIKKIADLKRGLILVTGATGSGKSTTLAAMIDRINTSRHAHIVTIEDPVEYLHPQKESRISQREIGKDTESFGSALRAALRQDPDIILIGEMRDTETIDIALKAAETGHVVFSTVHTTDALSTIGRIISMFPPEEQENIRKRLAVSLGATVSQRMLKKADGEGVVLAMEIMVSNPGTRECILGDEPLGKLPNVISKQKEEDGSGGNTFDQHIMDLYNKNLITKETALSAVTSQNDFLQSIMQE